MSGPPARGWEAVDSAEERLQQRAAARQRAEGRRRWAVRLLAPVLGAAVIVGALQAAGGDLRDWPLAAAVAVPIAALVLPAAAASWTARRDGAVDAVLWAAVTLAAEVALVFGVGFELLGLGPR